jgi:hypothetical protein
MKRSFNWTLQTMDLLSELHSALSETYEEWNIFISPDADVSYFSNLDEPLNNSPEFRHAAHAGRSLRSIKETFERLRNHQQKLVLLRDSLTKFSQTVRWSISTFSRPLFVMSNVPLTGLYSFNSVCLLRATK